MPLPEELVNQYGSKEVLKKLSPFLTEERKKCIEEVVEKRLSSIHVAIESPYDYHNALAVLRTAEAFGVNHLHIISSELRKSSGKKTTGGAKNWVHLHRHKQFSEFHTQIKEKKFLLFGASLDGDLSLEELPIEKPFCLLFGNENRGLSYEAESACDQLYKIPQYGVAESLNLSVAAGISLYSVTARKRGQHFNEGELSKEEKEKEQALYTIRTLGTEAASKMLLTST